MNSHTLNTINLMIRDYVIPAVHEAHEKHGPLTHEHCRAMTIMGEEFGESCAEILEYTRRQRSSLALSYNRSPIELPGRKAQRELAQLAAVAITLIANLEQEWQEDDDGA